MVEDITIINFGSVDSGLGTYAETIEHVVDDVNSFIIDKKHQNDTYVGKTYKGIYPPFSSGFGINSRLFPYTYSGFRLSDKIHILSPLVKAPKKDGIVTFHDLYYLYRQSSNNSYLKKAANSYKDWNHLIAVSNATKRDMISEGFDEGNITVIHHACLPVFRDLGEENKILLKKAIVKNKPIVLSVGDGLANKNTELVNKACKESWLHIHVGTEKADINYTKVSSEFLNILYNVADVYVRPASFEGFGYPAIESLCAGTPAVVGDIPVYHETLGEAGIYVKQDIDSVRNALEKAVNEKNDILSKFNRNKRQYFSIERFKNDMIRYYSNSFK